MQFFLNGYQPGDPTDSRAALAPAASLRVLPAKVDVLIVGCGPAGLTLATQLAAFADIKTCIIETKPGPLQRGQADGVSGRSIEIFQAFGFAERVMREAYQMRAICFWRYDQQNPENIIRTEKRPDGRNAYSEFGHVILNQARVHDFLLDRMQKSPAQLTPDYHRRLVELDIAPGNDAEVSHPITVTVERLDEQHAGELETLRARYVVGCDGARSAVRKSLGIAMRGDSANKAWGVMDLLLVTDFPDIRMKCVIQSASAGNLMIIPREGGHLVRFYIELERLEQSERVANLNITCEQLVATAQRIFQPYSIDVKEVVWWSVYEIGQRVSEGFDNSLLANGEDQLANVFIAGDACHTHSPKAGQGMNVSIHDSFNLGWKLAAVIRGQCRPELLLSYATERREIAQELIAFDRKLAAIFSQPMEASAANSSQATELESYVVKLEGFMSGTMAQYAPSLIIAASQHQPLAAGYPIGKRLHSAPVIRLADARPMHLGHVLLADGRWRIIIFADGSEPYDSSAPAQQLIDFLANSAQSPVLRFTPQGSDIDSVIEVLAVFQQHSLQLELERMPEFLLPNKGKYGLRDYGKIFCADSGADGNADNDIFTLRGINRQRGCMVITRPDQHVANVLALDSYTELSNFFAGFMLDIAGKRVLHNLRPQAKRAFLQRSR